MVIQYGLKTRVTECASCFFYRKIIEHVIHKKQLQKVLLPTLQYNQCHSHKKNKESIKTPQKI